jgi:hypothetical protein
LQGKIAKKGKLMQKGQIKKGKRRYQHIVKKEKKYIFGERIDRRIQIYIRIGVKA